MLLCWYLLFIARLVFHCNSRFYAKILKALSLIHTHKVSNKIFSVFCAQQHKSGNIISAFSQYLRRTWSVIFRQLRTRSALSVLPYFGNWQVKQVTKVNFLVKEQNMSVISTVEFHDVLPNISLRAGCMHAYNLAWKKSTVGKYESINNSLFRWYMSLDSSCQRRAEYSKMFRWESEGRYRCTKSTAIIVPFYLGIVPSGSQLKEG